MFVCIDGADGIGKTTLAERLAESLDAQFTFEPTGGRWGKLARQRADQKEFDSAREFFILDREEHITDLVAPGVGRGEIFICDRYHVTFAIHQCAPGAPLEAWLKALPGFVLPRHLGGEGLRFLMPHLTYLLHGPFEVCQARLQERSKENLPPWVWTRYDYLAGRRGPWTVLDGTRPIVDNVRLCRDQILSMVGSYWGEKWAELKTL